LVGALLWWGNYQSRHALRALLETASRHEMDQDWPQAATYLQRFLQANPADDDAFERFAKAYSKTASSRHDKVRSVAFSHAAWKKNPKRNDLALDAARTAFEIGEYRRSLRICERLMAADSVAENCRDITLLRADVLLENIAGNAVSTEYSWEDLANVLEAARSTNTNQIRYEVELAKLWQERLVKPDQKTRTNYANEIMNDLVAKHPSNPMAWLARHRYSLKYRLTEVQAVEERAQKDLGQALLRADQAKPAGKTAIFLAAASHSVQAGNLADAEQYLTLAIAATPREPRSYVALAELKRSSGDSASHQEAIELLQKGLEVIGKQDVALLLPLASLQVETRDWGAAKGSIAPLERIISRLSGSRRSELKLGVGLVRTQIIWNEQGVFPAIRPLEAIVNDEDVRVHRQLFPELFAQAHVLLGKLYNAVNIYDRASEQYHFALQLAPGESATRTEAVSAAMKAGDLESAELHCRLLLRDDSKSREALLAMIRIQVRRQLRQPPRSRSWTEAQRAYEKASELNVAGAGLLLAKVELLYAQGDFVSAERLLVKAVEQAPQNPRLWRELTILFDHKGQIDRAIASAERYIELASEEIDAYVLKATLLEKANRSKEAEELLSSLLQRCSGKRWFVAAQELARLQLLLGNVDEAKALLEEVHQKEPAHLNVISTLANLAWVAADWKSLQHYEACSYEVEGEAGTLWRFHRAQRLLEDAVSTNDPKFEEVRRLSQAMQDLRPRWSKTSLLLGDIALRSGQIDAAISYFQRSWNLGDRSALLADRLIELLTKQGRFGEAQSYVSQVSGALSLSSRLFDRAIPYYVNGNGVNGNGVNGSGVYGNGVDSIGGQRIAGQRDGQATALELAEAWVARQPLEASAYLRLGRVLLLMSSADDAERDRHRQRAKGALQQALQLAPSDASVWIANVMFGLQDKKGQDKKGQDKKGQDQKGQDQKGQGPGDQAHVRQVVMDLSQQVEVDDFSRAFVLAQVNEALERPLDAQENYRRAIELARQQEGAAVAEVLGQAAQFYIGRVPFLAEYCARTALTIDPIAQLPRQVLLQLLADRSEQEAVEEGLALLGSSPAGGFGGRVDLERRLRAKLLHQQGSGQTTQAIGLLETLLQQTAEDKLLLASLYERKGRIGPAFDLLSGLADSKVARSRDQIAFLEFWQHHFLTKVVKQERPKFFALAGKIYDQLRQSREQQSEWLRWKIRERKQSGKVEQLSWQEVQPQVAALVKMNQNLTNWSDEAKLVWCRSLLAVFLQEDMPVIALQFVNEPPAELLEPDIAIALCHAMIMTPVSSELRQSVNEFLRNLRTEHDRRDDLARAIGDYQFMTGQYELASVAYRAALAIDPSHKLASNNLALSLAEQPGKLAEAIVVLSAALAENDSDLVLLDTRAVLELIDQRADDALASLKQVLAISPENVAARIHVAMGYQALGNEASMRASLLDAMVLGINQSLLSPRDRTFLQELSRGDLMEKPAEYFRPNEYVEQCRQEFPCPF